MPELIARAKANPGKLNWTSPGAGTTPYLAGEVLQLRTGIKMVHIPFQGAGPAITAVLGGQVDMYTANLGSLQPQIAGRQSARARRHGGQALARSAGRSDARRGRRA